MMDDSVPACDAPAVRLVLPFQRDWALFLDVDGTLMDYIANPAEVDSTPDLTQTLSALMRLTQGALALVSGRSITDLDRIFGLPSMPCAGQHGLEIRFPDGCVHRDDAIAHRVAALAQSLRRETAGMTGVMVEYKGLSATLHYRQAPRAREHLGRLVRTLLDPLGEELQLMDGNHAFEVKPVHWNKGHAIRALMAISPFSSRIPVFLGDDRTDEDGFAVVNALQGHSVKVGAGPTVAGLRADSPAAVRCWLRGYVAYLAGGRPG